MDFNRKLYFYCIHSDITKRKITNCYKIICEVQENYGGFNLLQCCCIKAYLNSLKRRIERMKDEALLNYWNYLFADFVKEIENALVR